MEVSPDQLIVNSAPFEDVDPVAALAEKTGWSLDRARRTLDLPEETADTRSQPIVGKPIRLGAPRRRALADAVLEGIVDWRDLPEL